MVDRIEPHAGDYTSKFDRSTPLQTARDKILDMRIEKQPGYEAIERPIYTRQILELMQYLVRNNFIDTEKLRTIIDFGAGDGHATFVLASIARAIGAKIKAVDISRYCVESASKILPPNTIERDDGINYLSDPMRANTFDLITAFLLGSDPNGVLFRELAQASSSALNNGGVLLITSDSETLIAVRKVISRSGFPSTYIKFPTGEIAEAALIVPKTTCAAISVL